MLSLNAFLGQLPKVGSRPNNIGGKMSVRPQKVSSIWMKFGI